MHFAHLFLLPLLLLMVLASSDSLVKMGDSNAQTVYYMRRSIAFIRVQAESKNSWVAQSFGDRLLLLAPWDPKKSMPVGNGHIVWTFHGGDPMALDSIKNSHRLADLERVIKQGRWQVKSVLIRRIVESPVIVTRMQYFRIFLTRLSWILFAFRLYEMIRYWLNI